MINFYGFYNKTGLDKEEYRDKIVRVKNFKFDDAGSIAHIIKRTPLYAVGYTLGIGKRWLEAEPYIMKDPVFALQYAQNFIKSRWIEAEPYIIKDAGSAYLYARGIIKGRWYDAEPLIMLDYWYALQYATDVIKKRWPEVEPFLSSNVVFWQLYCQEFGI